MPLLCHLPLQTTIRRQNPFAARLPVRVADANLREALRVARTAVTTGDLICITGSFYLVGEAKKLFKNGDVPL